MKLVLSIILVMFLSGCCSTKVENKNEPIFHFIDKYIPKLEKYIENDQSLSIRDKNTFYIELNDYKEKRKNHSF